MYWTEELRIKNVDHPRPRKPCGTTIVTAFDSAELFTIIVGSVPKIYCSKVPNAFSVPSPLTQNEGKVPVYSKLGDQLSIIERDSELNEIPLGSPDDGCYQQHGSHQWGGQGSYVNPHFVQHHNQNPQWECQPWGGEGKGGKRSVEYMVLVRLHVRGKGEKRSAE